MNYPTILIKVAGALLLIWTLRSIFKHFAERKAKAAAASTTATAGLKADNKSSFSEQLLNNLLLYLWLAFMLIFSTGMILNN
jgi:threonine/homoserine/homoserine lactone efflux protein